MSRIGKQAITIPSGVQVVLASNHITVKGPKATLDYTIPQGVSVEVKENIVVVSLIEQEHIAMRGLTRTIIHNMVVGVSQGFEKKLHVIGVGFAAKVQGKKLILNLGFSHPVEYEAPVGITFATEKDQKGNDIIIVSGYDKQLVGQVAASLRSLKKPEPYKGKGIRYFGEKIRQKAGKTATK